MSREVERRIRGLSDNELLSMLAAAPDYTEFAISICNDEIAKRGGHHTLAEKLDTASTQHGSKATPDTAPHYVRIPIAKEASTLPKLEIVSKLTAAVEEVLRNEEYETFWSVQHKNTSNDRSMAENTIQLRSGFNNAIDIQVMWSSSDPLQASIYVTEITAGVKAYSMLVVRPLTIGGALLGAWWFAGLGEFGQRSKLAVLGGLIGVAGGGFISLLPLMLIGRFTSFLPLSDNLKRKRAAMNPVLKLLKERQDQLKKALSA